MTRPDIFSEVVAGLQEVKAFEEGRKTLSTYRLAPPPFTGLSDHQTRGTREKLGVSCGVFANQLRTSSPPTHTLENWEQDRAKPNGQAKALILLVAKHSDTLARLEPI